MGKRLRVAKTYSIKYAEKEAFNWMVTEVKDMFSSLDIECCDFNNEQTEGYGDMFEVDKVGYFEGITKLKEMDEADLPDEVTDVMHQCGISRDQLFNHLKEYYDLADSRSGYILFNFI